MRGWLTAVAALVLVAVAFGLGYAGVQVYRYAGTLLDPPEPESNAAVRIVIPAGASTTEVAGELYRRGLIREPLAFRYYARAQGLDGQIRSGEYELSPAMSVPEIFDQLVSGRVVTRRFTVPEGLTVDEMARHLEQEGLVAAADFLAAADDAAAAVARWVPAEAPVRRPVEGYLFPDTYVYDGEITAATVVEMMLARFEAVISRPELARQAEALALSVHEVVTLASIIEAEAGVRAEMPRISGVYHNRLGIGMKLDADPTVRYALNKPRGEPLLYADLEVEHPYNTYRNPGLPPGPIASPGEDAIRAALWPEEHDYFFFVARADGSGEHQFSETYDEHLAAVAEVEAAAGGQ